MNTKDQFALLQLIRKLELFRELDVEEGKTILRLCERVETPIGQVLWKPGDESDYLVVLLTGRMSVFNEQDEEIATVEPGGVFGEMGMLTGHKRFAGIRATEPSRSLCLSRRALRTLIKGQPAIYIKILETAVDLLSHRLTDTQHHRH